MRQSWIFDVLRDLKAYALLNGLPGLAAKADEALEVAEVEVAARSMVPGGDDAPDDPTAEGLVH
jgi:hypothetical protein